MQYVNLDSIAREFENGRTFFSASHAFRNLLDVVAWHEPLESEARFTSLDLSGVLSTLEDFSTYVELASIRANDFNPLEDAGFLRVTEQGSVQFLLDSEVKTWMVNAHDRRETVLLAAEVDRKGRVTVWNVFNDLEFARQVMESIRKDEKPKGKLEIARNEWIEEWEL